jgi:hypothetical protein
MLSRRTVTRVRFLTNRYKFSFIYYLIQQVCLTRLGHIALLRTAATSSARKNRVSKVEDGQKVKVKGTVEPELVEPVIDWLLDDTAEMPFIPVTGMYILNFIMDSRD